VKIEATAKQIRALLQLAELSAGGNGQSGGAFSHGHEAIQRGLPRLLLEHYQSLFDAGRTPAVVAIERGTCSGCHIRLPTMVESQTRRFPALHTCPHCRRLLYVPELVREHRQPDGKTASPVSAGRRS